MAHEQLDLHDGVCRLVKFATALQEPRLPKSSCNLCMGKMQATNCSIAGVVLAAGWLHTMVAMGRVHRHEAHRRIAGAQLAGEQLHPHDGKHQVFKHAKDDHTSHRGHRADQSQQHHLHALQAQPRESSVGHSG